MDNLTSDLINAVRANDPERVRKLLQEGADPNGYEDDAKITPLHFAAIEGCLEVVSPLVAAGADLNAKTDEGEKPIDVAANQSHGQMVNLLKYYMLNKPSLSDDTVN
jgi:ankyrin repeat protein